MEGFNGIHFRFVKFCLILAKINGILYVSSLSDYDNEIGGNRLKII